MYSYSNSSFYDHYLSSDEENEENTGYHSNYEEDEFTEDRHEEDDQVVVEDVSSHDIWKGKKKNTAKNLPLQNIVTFLHYRNVTRCREINLAGGFFNVKAVTFSKSDFFFFFFFFL